MMFEFLTMLTIHVILGVCLQRTEYSLLYRRTAQKRNMFIQYGKQLTFDVPPNLNYVRTQRAHVGLYQFYQQISTIEFHNNALICFTQKYMPH